MFKKVDPKVSFPKMEEEILAFWEKEKIFEKSVANREGAKQYSFYDGPPFATGTPHYGHIVASVMKDAVPRYWTMRGFQVERKWGWDCHGLPIENIAEKALGITRKKDIDAMGVEKFNEFCRSTVLQYVDEWKKVICRVGRWADMEHAYKTMDRDYMESVWWVFKELWDKGYVYESYRSMHICPRCETTLSQSEVAEGYKNVKDLSATAKFRLKDPEKLGYSKDSKIYLLAWTTTPWTLPGNIALAVGKDIDYVMWTEAKEGLGTESYIVSASSFNKMQIQAVAPPIKASQLIGLEYEPLFDCYAKDESLRNRENGWKIYHADFVNTEEGTGVVHIAPAFGEDDMNLGKEKNLPFVQHVNMDGTIKAEVGEGFSGLSVKPLENPQATDVEIIKYLAKKNLLFSKEKYEHSYPHCWRCDTPLLNYATSSWFVKVSVLKERAIELAEKIKWVPEHIKEGRFGKWLEGARDWSISRQRYWASVMPIWKCVCGSTRVFGSVKDLEVASGKEVKDLHKHVVDAIPVPCEKCGSTTQRVPDVLDTWFDSGSMPYAQSHYPFENKEKFDAGFPSQFIAEGIDQTRAWFYYLHIIAASIRDSNAFCNVIVNGIVLAEDGKKMSKKLKNYPDPMLMFDKYGADVVRLYLLSSPVVSAENLNFSERDLSDIQRNIFRMLWNSYAFFMTYAEVDNWKPKTADQRSENLLDRWILSDLQLLTKEVNEAMEGYELNRAARAFMPFVDKLSNRYIRRSRKRFWKNENDVDKEQAYQTLYDVLVTLSKLLAPFTPFIAEEIYRNLTGEQSVHLADFPEVNEGLIDEELTVKMQLVQDVITHALQERSLAQIKVRQPLGLLEVWCKDISHPLLRLEKELLNTIEEEVNVKKICREEVDLVSLKDPLLRGWMLQLDTVITPELKLEGEAREIIRAIQEGRKKAGFNVEDRIVLGYDGKKDVFAGDASKDISGFQDMIAREVLATEVKHGEVADAEYSEEVKIEGDVFRFWLKRV